MSIVLCPSRLSTIRNSYVTADELAGNSFPSDSSDVIDFQDWIASLNRNPITDADVDAAWAEEMIRRDAEQAAAELAAQAESPALPVTLHKHRTLKGCFNLIDAMGRMVAQIFGRPEANKRLKALNAAPVEQHVESESDEWERQQAIDSQADESVYQIASSA